MRTTVDLPPAAYQRVKRLSEERAQSLSSTIADLTVRGLAQLGQPVALHVSERTGLPVVSVGRPVTSDEVAETLAED